MADPSTPGTEERAVLQEQRAAVLAIEPKPMSSGQSDGTFYEHNGWNLALAAVRAALGEEPR